MQSDRHMRKAAKIFVEGFKRQNLKINKVPMIFFGGYFDVGIYDRGFISTQRR